MSHERLGTSRLLGMKRQDGANSRRAKLLASPARWLWRLVGLLLHLARSIETRLMISDQGARIDLRTPSLNRGRLSMRGISLSRSQASSTPVHSPAMETRLARRTGVTSK